MEMDSKKRLIITSVISIVLVSILMIGSTYSIFNSTDIDEEANVYQTGNLSVSLKSSENVTLNSSIPISSEEEVGKLTPYRVTVTNNGTVPYKFNVILTPTTATSEIDHQFVMVKVGKLEAKPFDSCTNNIIKEDIILLPNKSVNIDIRIYISDKIKNTEVDKNFSAKIKIDGVGAYSDNDEVDNSILEYPLSSVLLSSVPAGSYVKYVGNNGCSGKACEGQNANYVSDSDMGYCYSSSYKFQVNGWRIAYIQNESAYLVSAGSPECVRTYVERVSSSTSTQTLSTYYYYGSGYNFNETTGTYSLTGVTSSALAWSSKYSSIIANTPYTCKSTSSTATCSTMYKVTSYSSSTQGVTIPYYNYDGTGVPNHIAHLNQVALKYCNPNYAYNGGCNSTSSWSINDSDYQVLTTNIGTNKTLVNCFGDSNESCGKNYDLIDNGSFYWFATPYSASSAYAFYWYPHSWCVYNNRSNDAYGVRPVLRLRSSVLVVSGSGTYADPYVIE